MVFVYSFCEASRRFLWVLIRVENDSIVNYEKYREVTKVPDLEEIDDAFTEVDLAQINKEPRE
jgi:hypothetical protein